MIWYMSLNDMSVSEIRRHISKKWKILKTKKIPMLGLIPDRCLEGGPWQQIFLNLLNEYAARIAYC